MSQPLPPLNALRAFEAIARHLSFAKAAEEMHVTPAALSHQIRGLEQELGVSLFHRRTRAIELTEAGALLYPGVRNGFDNLRNAVRQLDVVRDDRILVISCTLGLAAKWLMPRLWRFMREHPTIDARVSATMDLADFASDGVDVAIRLMKDKDHPDLYVETLFADSMRPVCAPRLIEQGLHGPADLVRFPLIHYDVPTAMRAPPGWADWFAEAGISGDAVRGLRVNMADHALDAAVAGAGVSLSLKLIASDDVHAGRLVAPFGPELPMKSGYHFVCPKGQETRPKVKAFRDWVVREMADTKAKWAALEHAEAAE